MKTVLLGVTSSIACFKSVQLTSDLLKEGFDVEVIMSENATNFIQPLSFSSLTKHKTYINTFDRVENYDVEHISLADKADIFVMAPASANVIAKIANGIADDMLTTTFLACDCKKIIVPAMNTKMWENPITQENIQKCRQLGMIIVEPINGNLACGRIGKGKMADITTIIDEIKINTHKPILDGKKILISAGATREAIDPVRFITNHSSGKQGYALAKIAEELGAQVCLVSGKTNLIAPNNVELITINSAQDMFDTITNKQDEFDCIVMASAVSDYTIKNVAQHKIKKTGDSFTLELTKTKDILKYLGEHKPSNQCLVGFCMETENLINNAKEKLIKKNCDLIVANNLFEENAGFEHDTNKVYFIEKNSVKELPLLSKDKVALNLFNHLIERGIL